MLQQQLNTHSTYKEIQQQNEKDYTVFQGKSQIFQVLAVVPVDKGQTNQLLVKIPYVWSAQYQTSLISFESLSAQFSM